jgi:hypothetical protein
MAETYSLPGWPKKKLVGDVKKVLSRYGILPRRQDCWQAAWEWANQISNSYYNKTWPRACEIASQYIFLVMSQMKQDFQLQLPYRAGDHVPNAVKLLLPPPMPGAASHILAITEDTTAPKGRRRKPSNA